MTRQIRERNIHNEKITLHNSIISLNLFSVISFVENHKIYGLFYWCSVVAFKSYLATCDFVSANLQLMKINGIHIYNRVAKEINFSVALILWISLLLFSFDVFCTAKSNIYWIWQKLMIYLKDGKSIHWSIRWLLLFSSRVWSMISSSFQCERLRSALKTKKPIQRRTCWILVD